MVEHEPARLDAVFHALGDRTRRQMLRALASGERTVGGLAAPFDISLAAASKHIRVLEGAGLVQRAVAGRTHRLWLAPGPLARAYHWLGFYERFWSGRLDILERLLREDAATPAAPAPNAPPTPTRAPDPATAVPPAADPTLAEPIPPDLPAPEGDQP
jgi:DNA-binding transcriptional ArsR family regulator